MNAKRLRKHLLWCCALLVGYLLSGILNAGTFEFSSPSSKLVLGDYNGGATPVTSYFKNLGGSRLIGWDQQSIVRGNSQANTFTNAWTCSVMVGTASAEQVSYDLVVSTSNMAPIVRGSSQWVVNNESWIKGTSNWVANNGGLVVTLESVAGALKSALGAASKAAYDVLGLQQGIAQTAFDYTGTTTGTGSYSTSHTYGLVSAVAWNPGGNLLAVGENY